MPGASGSMLQAVEMLLRHSMFSMTERVLAIGERTCRMLKESVQQGRRGARTGGVPSGAHGAMNKEHHVCARRRVSEAAGSLLRILAS